MAHRGAEVVVSRRQFAARLGLLRVGCKSPARRRGERSQYFCFRPKAAVRHRSRSAIQLAAPLNQQPLFLEPLSSITGLVIGAAIRRINSCSDTRPLPGAYPLSHQLGEIYAVMSCQGRARLPPERPDSYFLLSSTVGQDSPPGSMTLAMADGRVRFRTYLYVEAAYDDDWTQFEDQLCEARKYGIEIRTS